MVSVENTCGDGLQGTWLFRQDTKLKELKDLEKESKERNENRDEFVGAGIIHAYCIYILYQVIYQMYMISILADWNLECAC